MTDAYSPTADEQLDRIEREDPDAYNAILDTCDLIFTAEALAQARSTAITTEGGITFRLPVVGTPLKVFWRRLPEGPQVVAVFPYSTR